MPEDGPWAGPALGDGGEGRPASGQRRRASRPGDEEPLAHPAQKAAAAGRLHCLTTTRAGFSPRPANPRDTSLEDKRASSSRPKKTTA
ncbi:zinc finger protein 664 isoform X3 [Callithrix jacchus]